MTTTLHEGTPASATPVRTNAIARAAQRLESAIQWSTELLAVCLMVAEVSLLLTNVIFRYALHDPLVWGDELASLLFIWLAMIGAVIALQRGEHMRLTTFVARMAPGARALCNTLADVITVAFVLLLIGPAWEYAQEEWAITTPALGIPNTFRVMSIVVGAALMLAIAALRLTERAAPRDAAKSIAVVAGLAAVLYFARPLLAALGTFNLVLFLVIGVATLVAIGVPIMVAFGLSTLAYLASATQAPLLIVVSRMDEGMSGIILLAVPLFVLLGALIEAMGMARAMIRFLASLIGHVRGGLSYVLVGAMYLVSGISGSKVADMAAVAPALFPEMKNRGEDDGELVSMLAASGAMSETIPPSLVLITIGSVTGVSIAALFTGGFMPAVIGALAMVAVIFMKSRRQSLEGVRKATPKEIGRALTFALPAVILPFVIRAAVVEGVATATEVSAIGVAYTFIVGTLVYREFDWKRLYPILVEAASLSGAILIIIGCATAMAWALTQSGFSAHVAHLMTALGGGKTGFLIVSAIAFVLLGSFLEGIPAIVLFGPLLFPVARALGVHEVHYAMVVIFSMGLGLFAPPIGVGYYAACAIGKVDPDRAMKRIWPYLGALIVALVVIAAFPWLSIGFL
ncbi:TRAP transporter large permease subunit [Variovorax sp. J22R133]|uniref:TRAP transporter large permease n=1 Tax=Variovorax brevis TaxID=3053503 RepID=UPI0025775789|nr:TRAP transporter large permease subunit [Variovorax sp. J22R133]MDM0116417.1 TRAP transporter large permease subunit [Variovorax sp. J22R133]